MKLSFSTLSCPDWNFREIYATAADLGYDGIEIRGIADEIYAPKIYAFSDEKLESTKAHLTKRSLEIPILTSGAYVTGNENFADAEKEIDDYCALAKKLNIKYVRVLMEKTPDPELAPDAVDAAAKYEKLCAIAAKYGVSLLTETNGFLANTKICKAFMDGIDAENKGLIFDGHHPYRFFGEKPEESIKNIGKYVKHVHFKDSVKGSNGKITYMLTGYGDYPFEAAVKALADVGYDGYLSYEWVKRWSRELAEPGVALFQYINYMKTIID